MTLNTIPAPSTPPPCTEVPLLGMSALTGARAQRFMPAVLSTYRLWNKRVPTSQLNRWLEQVRGGGWVCVWLD